MARWQEGVRVMSICRAMLASLLLLGSCDAPELALAKPAEAVLSPQVEAVLVQVEHAYVNLKTLNARNHAVMRIGGQVQRMSQTLQWDTSAKTMRWERGPLVIEIARSRVSVVRQGNVSHRTAAGNWADTIAAVTGAASAVPVEVSVLCHACGLAGCLHGGHDRHRGRGVS